MKYTGILLMLLCMCTACKENASKNIAYLEGYWEIEKVVFPDGNTKTYTINQNIDYISFEDDQATGYRKKLQPNLDGSFNASDDAERFEINIDKGTLTLSYKNNFSEWKEQIVRLNKNELVILNENNLKYFYKRFEKLDFTD